MVTGMLPFRAVRVKLLSPVTLSWPSWALRADPVRLTIRACWGDPRVSDWAESNRLLIWLMATWPGGTAAVKLSNRLRWLLMAVTGSPPALGAAASLQPWVRRATGEPRAWKSSDTVTAWTTGFWAVSPASRVLTKMGL